MNILLACDLLADAHRRKIEAEVVDWATIHLISQETSAVDIEQALAETDLVIGWAPAHLLANSPVRVYLCGSAGLDGYLGAGLETKPDFRICSAGSVMAVPIAEHLLALMLALTREIPTIVRQQSARHWSRRWGVGEISGTSVCVVGLGNSGSEIARRCKLLGLRVTGVRRNFAQGHPDAEAVFPVSRLAEAVRQADHVIVTLPGGPATRHLVNAKVFEAMKPGARFYTASRGSVVDEAALIGALRSGRLRGAGLDVFAEEPLPPSSPLWSFDNVIISPHSAGLSIHLADRLCDHFCDNLRRCRRGQPLVNEVVLSRYAAADL